MLLSTSCNDGIITRLWRPKKRQPSATLRRMRSPQQSLAVDWQDQAGGRRRQWQRKKRNHAMAHSSTLALPRQVSRLPLRLRHRRTSHCICCRAWHALPVAGAARLRFCAAAARMAGVLDLSRRCPPPVAASPCCPSPPRSDHCSTSPCPCHAASGPSRPFLRRFGVLSACHCNLTSAA